MYEYINENTIKRVPRNGTIEVNGEMKSISNLPEYFEANKSIANSLGYYDYVEAEQPDYDYMTQYLVISYSLENNVITGIYTVVDYTQEELEQIAEYLERQ